MENIEKKRARNTRSARACRQKKIKEHRCAVCGCGLSEDYLPRRCAKCLAKNAQLMRDYHARLRARGVCVRCAKRRAYKGRLRCKKCLEVVNALAQARVDKLKASHLCSCCGSAPLGSLDARKKPICETCHLKDVARRSLGKPELWQVLKEKLVAQDYKCAYTGQALTLGVNASLDHIYPLRHYPHLKAEPSNLVWVTKTINSWKNDNLPEDLMRLCGKIISCCQSVKGATVPAFSSPHRRHPMLRF